MRGTHGLTLVIALSGPAAFLHHAQAGELGIAATPQAAEFLMPIAELGDVNLSIVDDKLAMSLAVEAHWQIELTEFALASITDPQLKAHTEQKLRSYRRLYGTLNELHWWSAECHAGPDCRGPRRRGRRAPARSARNAAVSATSCKTRPRRLF